MKTKIHLANFIIPSTFLIILTPLPSQSSQISSNTKLTTLHHHRTTQTPNNNTATARRNKPLAIRQQFLIPHNALRARLGLPLLRWSEKLSAFADRWAQQRRSDCELVHSGSDYGENLFWGSGRGWRPLDAVAAWASERKYYDRRANRCRANRDCLHYTQMVWRKSLRIGCAVVVCETGDTFVTCNYDPPGNVVGQKPF